MLSKKEIRGEREDLTLEEERDAYKNEKQANDIAGRVARALLGSQMPEFGKGSPTIKDVAEIIGKDQTFVREGIEQGWLPIGICKPAAKCGGRREFYISPRKLWEVTGYIWKG